MTAQQHRTYRLVWSFTLLSVTFPVKLRPRQVTSLGRRMKSDAFEDVDGVTSLIISGIVPIHLPQKENPETYLQHSQLPTHKKGRQQNEVCYYKAPGGYAHILICHL